ncbi:MAG: hypothetical protein JAY99_11545 [Candidatus Thiodiazotropha lotti]|uniref:hypothetical protein n=1 Tax=Candidatus Thiodiazotropha endoloripes TaxID=1818881 RepID=UPI00083D93D3|nr:hypothetical protein [Candidatus Thiodiazotropha endoloripes]MCG7993019.1 hypothetical protein [Candidatus Thiodiazotropha lotti]MCW4184681.1 hypothetical protein [Candidatus Thiodiazotropha weberae]MCG8000153.1 hypothetical protein [Candidatus Thiodiazotropha lotti]MCW4191923.1 hypothetical protein [Candidatus Thiodiazotropha weberae]ODB82635.1 hypothetical protein A3194_17835 [Candidatus Thiodiazotropha endoloripes]
MNGLDPYADLQQVCKQLDSITEPLQIERVEHGIGYLLEVIASEFLHLAEPFSKSYTGIWQNANDR